MGPDPNTAATEEAAAMSDASERAIPPDPPPPRPRRAGRPILATLIGLFFILLPLGSDRLDMPAAYDTAERIGALLGGAVSGIIVWLIAYAVTIRRASRAWALASLLVLATTGLIAAVVGMGRHELAMARDIAAAEHGLASVMRAGAGNASFTPGADAGPITRLAAAAAAPMIADARRLNQAEADSGMLQIMTFAGLTTDAPVLRHCDKIAAVAPLALAIGRRFPSYLDAARAEGRNLVANGLVEQPAIDAFLRGFAVTQPRYRRQSGLAATIAEGEAAMCRILAHRNWHRGEGDRIVFDDDADMQAASALRARFAPALEEIDAAQQGGVATLKAESQGQSR
jgi:hypothetical protein